jgi:hypothetical protein
MKLVFRFLSCLVVLRRRLDRCGKTTRTTRSIAAGMLDLILGSPSKELGMCQATDGSTAVHATVGPSLL